MAGFELAKYVIENDLDCGGYTINKKDQKRYFKIVYEQMKVQDVYEVRDLQ